MMRRKSERDDVHYSGVCRAYTFTNLASVDRCITYAGSILRISMESFDWSPGCDYRGAIEDGKGKCLT